MKRFLVWILLVLSVASLLADKYTGEFLYVGVGVRNAALGNALLAGDEDASMAFWNPAAMRAARQNLLLQHSENFDGLQQYDAAIFTRNYEGQMVGVMLSRLAVPNVKYTVLEDPSEELSYLNRPQLKSNNTLADYVLQGAYAQQWNPKMRWGAALKLIYRDWEDYSAYGFGVDLSLLYQLHPKLETSLVLRDAVSTVLVWDSGEKETITPSLDLGAAYRFQFPVILPNEARLHARVRSTFEGREETAQLAFGQTVGFDFYSGLEYDISEKIQYRMGMERKRFTVGMGLDVAFMNIDFAYLLSEDSDLGYSYRIALQKKW